MQVTIISPNVMTFEKKVFLQKYKIFRKGYRFLKIDSKIDLFNRLIDKIKSIISESIFFFEDRPSLVSKRKDLMKIPKVIFHMKPIPFI